MKNLWLHGMYWTVIGVLSTFLYLKTYSSETELIPLEGFLEKNYSVLKGYNEILFYDIDKSYSSDPAKYGHLLIRANAIKNASLSSQNVVLDNINLVKRNEKANISVIKHTLDSFYRILTEQIDEHDKLQFIKNTQTEPLIQNDTFWRSLASTPYANLLMLKNEILLEENKHLNYISDKVSRKIEISCSFGYRVGIAPKKALLFEGEKFEADVFIAEYRKNPNNGFTFTVDNQNLPINEGVSYYQKIEKTTGLKTLKVQAFLRNPATGEITTTTGEFQYHVLPKCRQNCE
jgi:hypothetical protein